MSDCLFCKIIAGEIPAEKVHEDELCVAFRDIAPVAPTHILIVPRKHIETLDDLESVDAALVGYVTHVASRVARQEGLNPEGYRLVWNCHEGAGQTVFHIHLHVLGGRTFNWPPG